MHATKRDQLRNEVAMGEKIIFWKPRWDGKHVSKCRSLDHLRVFNYPLVFAHLFD